MHSDTLTKHSPANGKKKKKKQNKQTKKTALFSVLIRGFESRFQDGQKKSSVYICDSIFSWHKYTIYKFSDEVHRAAIRCSTQKFDYVSLTDCYKICLTRERLPSHHNHVFFMSSLFGSIWEYKKNCAEQQLWSKINSMRNTDTSRRRRNGSWLWLDKSPHEWLRRVCWIVMVGGKVVRVDGKAKKKKPVKVYKWCENL